MTRKLIEKPTSLLCLFTCILFAATGNARDAAIIVDHNCTVLSDIPLSAINTARQSLKIVYGHTSHGSQLVDGMDGLRNWKGNAYAYNATGNNDALCLVDFYGNFNGSGVGDLGSNGSAWATATADYLDANTDTNVVIWS